MSTYSNETTCRKTCRTCLAVSDDMTSILETKTSQNIAIKDVIMSVTSIQISETDGLTLLVCSRCTVDAEGAYDFKIRCEASDAILRTKAESIAASLPKAEEEIKQYEVFEVKEEVDIKMDPYTSDGFHNDDDDEEDFDPVDTICLKESLELDDGELFYFKSSRKPFGVSSRKPGDAVSRKKKKSLKRDKPDKKRTAKVRSKKVRLKMDADLEESDEKRRVDGKKTTYTCEYCKAIFRSAHIQRKHLKRVHGMVFVLPTSRSAVRAQESTGNAAGQDAGTFDAQYKCSECEFVTETFSVLKRHTLLHTGDKPIFCDECNYRCVDVGSLVKHKRKHTGDRPYACELCVYRGTTPYSLKTHMATHSPAKPYSCQLCPFTCKLSSSLIQHVARRHERRKDHACPTCGKRFFSVSHMRIHQRVHSGEKPHVCDKCGTAFSQKSNLEKHSSLMHAPDGDTTTRRKFACDQCSYRANTLYTLRNHTLKHSGEKPAVCDLCDYKCISVSALKLHKQRHLGDARHACDTCPYRCYTLGRLKAHKRRHTGERPYPCTKCDYRAKTSCSLRNHMASHKNEQAYACKKCPYRANYKSNLVKHQQKLCGKMGKHNAVPATKASGDVPRDKFAIFDSTAPDDDKFKTTAIDNSIKQDGGIVDEAAQ